MASSSEALICRVHTRPHPNADRLLLGSANGYQVVVSSDTEDGSLGVFFSGDLCLSEEYATEHDLVGYTDDAGVKRGGFFAKNRRVRVQRFRGERSEGYFAPLDSLAFTKADLSKLQEGFVFSELNGVPICTKYFTPATLKAMGQQKTKRENVFFAKHIETDQLRHKIGDIPDGSLIYTTLKMHGTSFRVGNVINEREVKRTLWDKIIRRSRSTYNYETLIGTRNVIVGEFRGTSFYGTDAFRMQSAATFAEFMHKGEIIYGEIVGFVDENGTPLMPDHETAKAGDKELVKQYGDKMRYSYGCNPTYKPWDIYVYRITHVSEDTHVTELSWPQVKARCGQLGLKPVPDMFAPFIYTPEDWFEDYGDKCDQKAQDELMALMDSMNDGPDLIDPTHIREGVVLRVEQPNGETRFLKSKGWTFRVLEGIAFENPDFVDTEAIT